MQAQAARRAHPITQFGQAPGTQAAVVYVGADEAAEGPSQLATMLVEYDSLDEGDSQSGASYSYRNAFEFVHNSCSLHLPLAHEQIEVILCA